MCLGVVGVVALALAWVRAMHHACNSINTTPYTQLWNATESA